MNTVTSRARRTTLALLGWAIGVLCVAPTAALPASTSINVAATLDEPFKSFDIDGDLKDDMAVAVTWMFDSQSGFIFDRGSIMFLGAFQGEFAITQEGYLSRFDAGHQISADDFAVDRRKDGASLWAKTWISETPGTGYGDGYMPSYPYDGPVKAVPVGDPLVSAGQWPEVGDTGYAVFRQSIDGGLRYGWVQLTHGSVEVGELGFGGTVAEVPEPATVAMMLAGLGLLGATRRRTGTASPRPAA